MNYYREIKKLMNFVSIFFPRKLFRGALRVVINMYI